MCYHVGVIVLLVPEAVEEYLAMPKDERAAMSHAIEKLRALGNNLGAPHSSGIRGSSGGLRELRPRGGRSPWRARYRQHNDLMVILAIGPEANQDKRGFERMVANAERRAAEL